MKGKIFLCILIISGFFSCRRDHVTPPALPVNNAITTDYRDTVLGTYIGTKHYYQTAVSNSIIIADTTFTDTIIVTRDNIDTTRIYFDVSPGTMRADLHHNFTFTDDHYFYYPHGYITGSFFLANDSLRLYYDYSYSGNFSSTDFHGHR
ncbi:hypothetical protein BH09BAC5_BH09BAC5_16750 [soil metagenome]